MGSGLGISGFLCQFKGNTYESLQICRGNSCIISLLIHLGDGNHMVPWGYTTLDQHWSIWKCQKFLKHCLHHQWMLNRAEMQRRGCLWKHFWPLYLKSMGMVLRIEKKKKKKETSTQTVTHSHHSCSSYQELSKADLFFKLMCWGFLFWLVSFFLRVDFRSPRRFTHLIMDPYREPITWRVREQA